MRRYLLLGLVDDALELGLLFFFGTGHTLQRSASGAAPPPSRVNARNEDENTHAL